MVHVVLETFRLSLSSRGASDQCKNPFERFGRRAAQGLLSKTTRKPGTPTKKDPAEKKQRLSSCATQWSLFASSQSAPPLSLCTNTTHKRRKKKDDDFVGIIYESRRTKILDDFGGVKNTCKYYVRDFNKKEEKRKRREALILRMQIRALRTKKS